LVDSHDSFTWNLAHYLEELGAAVDVRQNDEIDADEAQRSGFDAWVLSPGPGRPADVLLELVRAARATPLLGVCLGHQALAQAHGGRLVHAATPVHGKASEIHHDGTGLFQGLSRPFPAARYHSLVVEPASVPATLRVTARTSDGTVMALCHRTRPSFGVQFHPESVLTAEGKRLLANFLQVACAAV
jgi:anthranilate synthase component 2